MVYLNVVSLVRSTQFACRKKDSIFLLNYFGIVYQIESSDIFRKWGFKDEKIKQANLAYSQINLLNIKIAKSFR